jgi:serine/threonine protein kinase
MSERYKIQDKLGAGGVGAIYRAYDLHLKRWVAIKRLIATSETGNSQQEINELRKEADSLAALRHPNIVTIFDVASDHEGLFLVMELLEGEDLADVLQRGPLSLQDFKELIIQSLEGLLAAHHRGFLHRDIKPENIKVERLPGGRLQSKIIDFGLARAGMAAKRQTEDADGTVMGSIFYMAPEQLTREPVDARTDLYSLGVVFYEAISGKKAFDADTMEGVVDKHITHQIYSLTQVAPHVPQWMAAWIHRLMARHPHERPQNVDQAIEEFRAWEQASTNANQAYSPWAAHAQMGQYMQPMMMQPIVVQSVVPQPVYYTDTGAVTTLHQTVDAYGNTIHSHTTSHHLTTHPISGQLSRTTGQIPRSNPTGSITKHHTQQHDTTQQHHVHAKKSSSIGLIIAILFTLMAAGGGGYYYYTKKQQPAKPTQATKEPSEPTKPTQVKKTEPVAPAVTLETSLKLVSTKLPLGHPIPFEMSSLCLFYSPASGKELNGKTPNSPIIAWRDIGERGYDNYLKTNSSIHPKLSSFPKNSNHSIKPVDLIELQDGVKMNAFVTDLMEATFPFGQSVGEDPGMTFTFSGVTKGKKIISTLFSKDSKNRVTLAIDDQDFVTAIFHGSSDSKKIISNIKATSFFVATITWSKKTGSVKFYVHNQSNKYVNADNLSLSPPLTPLSEFNILNNGKEPLYIGDIYLYPICIKPENADYIRNTILGRYYFDKIGAATLQ